MRQPEVKGASGHTVQFASTPGGRNIYTRHKSQKLRVLDGGALVDPEVVDMPSCLSGSGEHGQRVPQLRSSARSGPLPFVDCALFRRGPLDHSTKLGGANGDGGDSDGEGSEAQD